PRSTPKRPATAKGPGVGGTAWWVTTRPAAKATPRVTTERPVWRAKALARGERITKPESQKMGMETTYPVEARAHSSRPRPQRLRKERAIRSAAPETSR